MILTVPMHILPRYNEYFVLSLAVGKTTWWYKWLISQTQLLLVKISLYEIIHICTVVHINFTSFQCTGRYEFNKLTSLPMCGFIAQLVEHCTGIAEVTSSNAVEALIFFQAFSFQLLKLEIYRDDHSSLS